MLNTGKRGLGVVIIIISSRGKGGRLVMESDCSCAKEEGAMKAASVNTASGVMRIRV